MLSEAAIAAFFAGSISAVSLPIGAALGLTLRPGQRLTAALMAFGAGALLFALTIEIVAHSFHQAGFWPLALGCVLGGIAFELINHAVNSRGGFLRKAATVARYITGLRRQKTESLLDRLARLRIFHALPPEEIAGLAGLFRGIEVVAGERLCSEGDRADALFVIDAGEVEVLRNGQSVARLGAGEMFGEMELVHDEPRLATVTAATALTLFRLGRQDFDALMRVSTAIRDKVHGLVRERSGDLAARELVSEAEAQRWRDDAGSMVIDESHIPTPLELRSTAKSQGAAAALGIWLGIMLDGIPESLVIGTTTHGFAQISWALIAGVFLANLPEAMSSSIVKLVALPGTSPNPALAR